MGRIVNQVELAEIMGVSKKSISLWQAEGLPVAVRGVRGKSNAYDTAEVITWFAARTAGKSEETSKDRLSRVQAERIEMEMARSRGDLIPASEIDPAWAGLVISTRQAMLAIAPGVAPLLAQLDDQDAMHDLLLESIEAALRKLAGGPDESGIVGATSEDEGEVLATTEDLAVEVG